MSTDDKSCVQNETSGGICIKQKRVKFIAKKIIKVTLPVIYTMSIYTPNNKQYFNEAKTRDTRRQREIY